MSSLSCVTAGAKSRDESASEAAGEGTGTRSLPSLTLGSFVDGCVSASSDDNLLAGYFLAAVKNAVNQFAAI